VGRPHLEILRHILVPSRIHRSIHSETINAFRGEHAVRADMLDLQGFYQSPLYLYIRRRGG